MDACRPRGLIISQWRIVTKPDVAVAGAGPAGLTAALRLARLGYRVTVYEKCSFPRARIGEALTPGIVPILEWLGLADAINTAGFLRPRSGLVAWDGAEERIVHWDVPGYHVDRSGFDGILLDAARSAGTRVVWQPMPPLANTFVIDATGRRGLIPAHRVRLGPPLLALYAYWRGVRTPGDGAVVEAGAEEWFWAATVPSGAVNVMVFLEPSRARHPEAVYLEALTRFSLLRGPLELGTHGPVIALDASSWVTLEPCGEGFIKTGESAFSVDALSSQGVQLAMQSGIQAAAVVNTIFSGGDGSLANAFYRSRQLTAAIHNHRIACEYYGKLSARGEFWSRRRVPQRIQVPDTPSGRLVGDLVVGAGQAGSLTAD